MNDQRKIAEGFNLFNEKAEKLLRLSFVQTMFGAQTGVTLSGDRKDDGGFELAVQRIGPNAEAIDAFVLTFRFFIQDNEKSSFHKLASYYSSPVIDKVLGAEFEATRSKINDFLDKPGDMLFKFNNEVLTRRIIMTTFIYGGLSHANAEKKKQYDAWMLIPPLKLFLENEFVYILSIILQGIKYIRGLNAKALQQLQ